jgi:ribosomal protein L7/L12
MAEGVIWGFFAVVIVAIAVLVVTAVRSKERLSDPPDYSVVGDEVRHRVARLLSQRKVVEAVKVVRDDTGWGLKDSRDFVNALRDGRTPPRIGRDKD